MTSDRLRRKAPGVAVIVSFYLAGAIAVASDAWWQVLASFALVLVGVVFLLRMEGTNG